MKTFQDLLSNNSDWAHEVTARDPAFFSRLSAQQEPDFLWIGCSDSRVPANQITGLDPGEVFVHRNIANVVLHADLNCLSVIQFAVDALQVEHIIVCGHYGCGGVQAALEGKRLGLVDNWLRHVSDIARAHDEILEGLSSAAERHARLCELNVLEQAANVCQTTVVRDAWERGQSLRVHGLVYGLEDGKLHDLGLEVSSYDALPRATERALARIAQGLRE
jgi:carbonic anhydrase